MISFVRWKLINLHQGRCKILLQNKVLTEYFFRYFTCFSCVCRIFLFHENHGTKITWNQTTLHGTLLLLYGTLLLVSKPCKIYFFSFISLFFPRRPQTFTALFFLDFKKVYWLDIIPIILIFINGILQNFFRWSLLLVLQLCEIFSFFPTDIHDTYAFLSSLLFRL